MNAQELVEYYKKTMPGIEFRIETRTTPDFTSPVTGQVYPGETKTVVLRVNHCPRCGREELDGDHGRGWFTCDCPEKTVSYKQNGATANELDEQWERDA